MSGLYGPSKTLKDALQEKADSLKEEFNLPSDEINKYVSNFPKDSNSVTYIDPKRLTSISSDSNPLESWSKSNLNPESRLTISASLLDMRLPEEFRPNEESKKTGLEPYLTKLKTKIESIESDGGDQQVQISKPIKSKNSQTSPTFKPRQSQQTFEVRLKAQPKLALSVKSPSLAPPSSPILDSFTSQKSINSSKPNKSSNEAPKFQSPTLPMPSLNLSKNLTPLENGHLHLTASNQSGGLLPLNEPVSISMTSLLNGDHSTDTSIKKKKSFEKTPSESLNDHTLLYAPNMFKSKHSSSSQNFFNPTDINSANPSMSQRPAVISATTEKYIPMPSNKRRSNGISASNSDMKKLKSKIKKSVVDSNTDEASVSVEETQNSTPILSTKKAGLDSASSGSLFENKFQKTAFSSTPFVVNVELDDAIQHIPRVHENINHLQQALHSDSGMGSAPVCVPDSDSYLSTHNKKSNLSTVFASYNHHKKNEKQLIQSGQSSSSPPLYFTTNFPQTYGDPLSSFSPPKDSNDQNQHHPMIFSKQNFSAFYNPNPRISKRRNEERFTFDNIFPNNNNSSTPYRSKKQDVSPIRYQNSPSALGYKYKEDEENNQHLATIQRRRVQSLFTPNQSPAHTFKQNVVFSGTGDDTVDDKDTNISLPERKFIEKQKKVSHALDLVLSKQQIISHDVQTFDENNHDAITFEVGYLSAPDEIGSSGLCASAQPSPTSALNPSRKNYHLRSLPISAPLNTKFLSKSERNNFSSNWSDSLGLRTSLSHGPNFNSENHPVRIYGTGVYSFPPRSSSLVQSIDHNHLHSSPHIKRTSFRSQGFFGSDPQRPARRGFVVRKRLLAQETILMQDHLSSYPHRYPESIQSSPNNKSNRELQLKWKREMNRKVQQPHSPSTSVEKSSTATTAKNVFDRLAIPKNPRDVSVIKWTSDTVYQSIFDRADSARQKILARHQKWDIAKNLRSKLEEALEAIRGDDQAVMAREEKRKADLARKEKFKAAEEIGNFSLMFAMVPSHGGSCSCCSECCCCFSSAASSIEDDTIVKLSDVEIERMRYEKRKQRHRPRRCKKYMSRDKGDHGDGNKIRKCEHIAVVSELQDGVNITSSSTSRRTKQPESTLLRNRFAKNAKYNPFPEPPSNYILPEKSRASLLDEGIIDSLKFDGRKFRQVNPKESLSPLGSYTSNDRFTQDICPNCGYSDLFNGENFLSDDGDTSTRKHNYRESRGGRLGDTGSLMNRTGGRDSSFLELNFQGQLAGNRIELTERPKIKMASNHNISDVNGGVPPWVVLDSSPVTEPDNLMHMSGAKKLKNAMRKLGGVFSLTGEMKKAGDDFHFSMNNLSDMMDGDDAAEAESSKFIEQYFSNPEISSFLQNLNLPESTIAFLKSLVAKATKEALVQSKLEIEEGHDKVTRTLIDMLIKKLKDQLIYRLQLENQLKNLRDKFLMSGKFLPDELDAIFDEAFKKAEEIDILNMAEKLLSDELGDELSNLINGVMENITLRKSSRTKYMNSQNTNNTTYSNRNVLSTDGNASVKNLTGTFNVDSINDDGNGDLTNTSKTLFDATKLTFVSKSDRKGTKNSQNSSREDAKDSVAEINSSMNSHKMKDKMAKASKSDENVTDEVEDDESVTSDNFMMTDDIKKTSNRKSFRSSGVALVSNESEADGGSGNEIQRNRKNSKFNMSADNTIRIEVEQLKVQVTQLSTNLEEKGNEVVGLKRLVEEKQLDIDNLKKRMLNLEEELKSSSNVRIKLESELNAMIEDWILLRQRFQAATDESLSKNSEAQSMEARLTATETAYRSLLRRWRGDVWSISQASFDCLKSIGVERDVLSAAAALCVQNGTLLNDVNVQMNGKTKKNTVQLGKGTIAVSGLEGSKAEDALTCILCQRAMTMPLTLIKCGHSACMRCLEKDVRNHGDGTTMASDWRCPICIKIEDDKKKAEEEERKLLEEQKKGGIKKRKSALKTVLKKSKATTGFSPESSNLSPQPVSKSKSALVLNPAVVEVLQTEGAGEVAENDVPPTSPRIQLTAMESRDVSLLPDGIVIEVLSLSKLVSRQKDLSKFERLVKHFALRMANDTVQIRSSYNEVVKAVIRIQLGWRQYYTKKQEIQEIK